MAHDSSAVARNNRIKGNSALSWFKTTGRRAAHVACVPTTPCAFVLRASLMPPPYRLTLVLLLTALPAMAQESSRPPLTPAEASAWRSDLDTLAAELPRRHPNPFRTISRDEYLAKVRALRAAIPELTRVEVEVRLMEIVALIGDAHTSLNPLFEPGLGFHYYPIGLQLFADGLYVESADSGHRALVGAKVVGIGHISSAEEAIRRAAAVIPHENDQWVKAQAPHFLVMPEILMGLRVIADPAHTPLILERSARRDTVFLAPAGLLSQGSHGPGPVWTGRTGWFHMNDSSTAPLPLWLQHRTDAYWMQYLADTRTLYVAYRAVVSNDNGESNEAFFRRVFATIDTARVDRLVLDLRENGGGNGFYNRYVVRGVLERPTNDTAGKLFVIIGRHTFSAAQNLVNDLERWSSAIFVGEPTGNAPNFFGDHEPIELPHSHLHVMVSTLWWQQQDPRDHWAWVPPQVATEMTAADYRNNVDPAMVAVLSYAGRLTVAQLLTEALADRDSTRLTRALTTFRSNPENRYAPIEQDINRLGYELLQTGRVRDAVRIFRLNVAEFPQSANAYDSFGEALEQAGQRDEAIAAYRRAVQIVPAFPPSQAALARLRSEQH